MSRIEVELAQRELDQLQVLKMWLGLTVTVEERKDPQVYQITIRSGHHVLMQSTTVMHQPDMRAVVTGLKRINRRVSFLPGTDADRWRDMVLYEIAGLL